ncbi:hypothetical protein G7Y89_g5077 [Cudoniella acicularis]|uniref:BZIP domain-containing protein n=1 Tax=Cudoniella acicularis TaxID=354080 RepID=A0A8H4RNZ8_9HELO|nr:hypothetical protein G7Y89_g5077 [Cudoniella acicularis]
MMPRPEILVMGTNYRRIPILPIGRDIYNDTRLILTKLESLYLPSSSHPAISASSNTSTAEHKSLEKLFKSWVIDAGMFTRVGQLIPTNMLLLRDENDLTGLKKGQEIEVWPTDTGFANKDKGKLVALNKMEVIIKRENKKGETVRVHSPRYGFRPLLGRFSHAAKKGDTKSPVQPNADPPKPADTATDVKPGEPAKNETNADPLGPPPRPGAGPSQQVPNTPDYFSVNHSHIREEQNPFEASFAFGSSSNGGGAETPGGTKLPSVAALTSPAGILGPGVTPNFWGSLRSGPLSPAMLSGPQKDDYFSDGHHLRGGFPTPNESGLRSGLTPGGGGSMFPEPSPNSQALFSQLASGGATPTTLDFHRTAMSAAAQKRENHQPQQSVTSQPQEMSNGMEVKPPALGQFDQHDANDAANGLFLLAQARSNPPQTNHYAMAPQMPVHAHPPPNMQMGGQSSETSPHMANRNNGSISTTSGRGVSEMSGYSDENEQQSRPNTRGKGKRSAAQNNNQSNGRRKVDDTPSKGPANKKSKANNGHAMQSEPQSDEEEGPDLSKDEYNANGKKMTDEEKRKNFLERNRVAALKCRQRKKQWLANLQQKVELFSSENDQLSQQISQLREEIVNLKTILMAHKDCPVSQQQGLGGMGMQQFIDGYGSSMNPYGMAAAAAMGGQVMQVAAGQGMQDRRFS